jgi:hypothetical protein
MYPLLFVQGTSTEIGLGVNALMRELQFAFTKSKPSRETRREMALSMIGPE